MCSIQVNIGQRYLLGVNGTCSAGNVFLYVKQSQQIWRPQTVKLCRDSCLSFTANSNSIDVGVLFGAVVAYGDKFTIHSWTLVCEPEGVKAVQESALALRSRWDEMQLAVADLASRYATMNERARAAEKELVVARAGKISASVVAMLFCS